MSQVIRILTYDEPGCGTGCQTWNSLVNYAMCLLAICCSICMANEPSARATRACASPTTKNIQAWASLVFFTAFQIALCLFVDCVGISIIWNSALGYALVEYRTEVWGGQGAEVGNGHRRRQHQTTLFIFYLTCVVGMAVDVLYAVIAGGETTLAHVLAVLLGALCKGVWRLVNTKLRSQHAVPATTDDARSRLVPPTAAS